MISKSKIIAKAKKSKSYKATLSIENRYNEKIVIATA
jgi:hypothetical protein